MSEVETAVLLGPVRGQSLPFGTTAVIYQEILQGAARQQDFEELRGTSRNFDELAAYFGAQRFYRAEGRVESYLGPRRSTSAVAEPG